MTGPAPQLSAAPAGTEPADPRPAGGGTGCAPTWIRCGGRANGTAQRDCSPVICTATGPRRGRAGPRAARPRPAAPRTLRRVPAGPHRRRAQLGGLRRRPAPAPPVRCCPSGVARCPVARASLHCRGLCFRHEQAWRRPGRPSPWRTSPPGPARSRAPRTAWSPAAPASTSAAAGSAVSTTTVTCEPIRPADRRPWAGRVGGRGAQPLLGVHQFCLAGLPELLGVEVLYALQQRDLSPLPMDPTQVRILLARLTGADHCATPTREAVCESGGTEYNSATRGLFRDLRRHLDRAWVQHTGTDPTAGDLWQVALLGLHPNASRPWPATHGVVDFRPIEPPWLRESSRTGPAPPGRTCSGSGRRCAPARPPPRP